QIPAARVTCDPTQIPDLPEEFHADLVGRVTWTKEAERVDVEIVLRAFLAGSGWREYATTGRLWEHELPEGMQKSSALAEVLHTPTTKDEVDEPITWEQAVELIGNEEDAKLIHQIALDIFNAAGERTAEKGIRLADTKFEFGRIDGQLVLIDEVMTPDSSRYWPADQIHEGQEPPSFDKEIVRAYLRSIESWDKTPPPPPIPAEVIVETRGKYLEICQILTGCLPEGVEA
ncbi:MAG: phosphoribosylaminoimidazolesuccinocarboxamide synthase, partial [Planctomycetes bacterium]|nr:phosphoribosylaminoimidazolesuccinocarboxamide synthase [Planctomycetota bacterium]